MVKGEGCIVAGHAVQGGNGVRRAKLYLGKHIFKAKSPSR
jgi:hypothetical protein